MHTVTDARRPLSVDIDSRQRRYLISMGIRTACLLAAVLVPMPLPLRIVAIIAAITLPYFAVVFANGGRQPERAAEFTADPPAARRRGTDEARRQIGP